MDDKQASKVDSMSADIRLKKESISPQSVKDDGKVDLETLKLSLGSEIEASVNIVDQKPVRKLRRCPVASREASLNTRELLDKCKLRNSQQESLLTQGARQVSIELMKIVNTSSTVHELINATVTFFQKWSGCEAVGIRLKDGEDYPYFEARGFAPEFIQLENKLCAIDSHGQIIRDCIGNPVIECMCGNIICGRFDASMPFFTPHGSFWTNCTTELLASTTDNQRQARTRNRCHGEGYESVALIPLCVGNERLGLLQLNDKRKGLFSREFIQFWEELAHYLSIALAKFRTDEILCNSEKKYRSLFENMAEGAFYQCSDGSLIEVNHAALEIFGLTREQFLGKAYEDSKCWNIIHEDGSNFECEMFPPAVALKTGKPVLKITAGIYNSIREQYVWTSINAIPQFRNGQEKPYQVFVILHDITERKKAEDALRDSEQELATIYEDVPIIMLLIDSERRVYKVNKLGASFINKPGKDIAGLRFGEVLKCLHSLNDPRGCGFGSRCHDCAVRNCVNEAFEKGYDHHLTEVSLQIGSKEEVQTFTFLLSTSRLSICGNIRLLVTLQNITKLKQIDEKLVESENRLRLAVDSAGMGMWEWNLQTNTSQWSENLFELLGLPVQDGNVCSDVFFQHLHPEGEAKFKASLTRVMQCGTDWRNECRVIRADGEMRWLACVGRVFRDINGQAQRMIGITYDITDIKHAQEEVKLSESKYKTLFSTMTEGFALHEIICNENDQVCDYRFLEINPAFERLTGLVRDNIVGKTMTEVLPTEDPYWIKTYGDVALTGQSVTFEHYSPVLNRYYHALAYCPSPRRFAVIFSDISEIKQAHEQTARYQNEIAHASRLSTIGQMASSLAHELNQPLCAVLTHAEGCVNMLNSESPNFTKLLSKCEIIAKQAHRAGQIINHMKTFARKKSSEIKDADLNQMIHEVIEFLDIEIKKAKVRIQLRSDDSLPIISVDTLEIEQVLINIIKNSLEAMDHPDCSIRVLDISIGHDSENINIAICDSGMGMGEGGVTRLFEPFFTTKSSGLGLGMSISKSIIESHGGQISASANSHGGLTVLIKLPAK